MRPQTYSFGEIPVDLPEWESVLFDNDNHSENSYPSVPQECLKRKVEPIQDIFTCTEELNPISCTGVFEAICCCFCASAFRKSIGSDIHSRSPMNKSQLTSVPLKTQVVVLGPSRVGKTALVLRYLRHHFEADYEPTIEDVYNHKIILPGKFSSLNLLLSILITIQGI
ncbi:hypothetical protein NPIL_28581 [Nephila pilipes]|uniref:Uncharacterized protein n=1 Tax=Nephila pilipes TaxID=299642 RepID=A0A8X6UV80_NEPPI|nr:hypothetical protein NPIL_28581 [Nephila pilipes]